MKKAKPSFTIHWSKTHYMLFLQNLNQKRNNSLQATTLSQPSRNILFVLYRGKRTDDYTRTLYHCNALRTISWHSENSRRPFSSHRLLSLQWRSCLEKRWCLQNYMCMLQYVLCWANYPRLTGPLQWTRSDQGPVRAHLSNCNTNITAANSDVH